jgi:hypothetical protein
MSTTSSTSGQASHTRSSTVGRCALGRMSKYTIPASEIVPEAISSSTMAS